MLFRTVYGLELEAIYHLVLSCNRADIFPTKQEICRMVMPVTNASTNQTSQSAEDALSFLYSAGMFTEDETTHARFDLRQKPFQLQLLEQLVRIWKGALPAIHPLDPLYMHLLDELYISPNNFYIFNVHQEANRLKIVRDVGGLTKEKIQAWKRVLEFLGVGLRAQGGFMCTYTPTLIRAIVNNWAEERGVLQDFLETHFSQYLPYRNKTGEIAEAAVVPLKILEKEGFIELGTLNDSPSHFYFGDQKLRGIARRLPS